MPNNASLLKGLVAGAVIGVLGVFPALAQERVVRVTNWAEYNAEDTWSKFEEETGIKVIFDPYDSVEAIDSKLLAGNSGYDVVSHSSTSVRRLAQAGILSKLDKSKLDNFKHMDPSVMSQLDAGNDPGNEFIAPFMWGTHGVTVNKDLILATHPDAPIGSMELIFDPNHMKELAKCGVSFLDSPTDMIPMALAHLGLDPASNNKADYDKAKELLLAVRPYIKTFDNYAYTRMPEKEFCVSVTWGPDGLFAMSGAQEANTGVVLDFFIPPGQGKANVWVDGWVIPADAQNVEEAHLLINYLMRPDIGAADSNYTWYATANKTAIDQGMVDEAVTSSAASYPPPEQVARMYPLPPVKPKIERIRTRVWTDFKNAN